MRRGLSLRIDIQTHGNRGPVNAQRVLNQSHLAGIDPGLIQKKRGWQTLKAGVKVPVPPFYKKDFMRLIIAYKNFAAHKHISHIGLGVSAINTAQTLRDHGIETDVWPIIDSNELRRKLNHNASAGHKAITHVVVSAPWIATLDMRSLSELFPYIKFVMVSHSNVGFLQADSNGVKLIREGLELEMSSHNFKVAGNSKKFCRWIEETYGRPCIFLPNLYHNQHHENKKHHRPGWKGGVLRLGIFGATRPQKNIASAVGAALQIAYQTKAETQIHLSSGRSEGGGDVVLRAVREMVRDVPNVSLHEAGWQTWPSFRRLIGSMHLLLQPSYTESFNMVTADGIAEGVPSVVSDAIDWVPSDWRAHFDDVYSMAEVGRHLLRNPLAPARGRLALAKYINDGIEHWEKYLKKGKCHASL